MDTVKALWIVSVFATSALVGLALTDGRNQMPVTDVPAPSVPSDAGTQLPKGYALETSDGIALVRCSWDASL
jgi:hypothetical protein